MKIDIHTHILPSRLPDLQSRYGCPGWINIRQNEQDPNLADMYKDDKFFRRIEKNCWCLSDRCSDMCKTNVSAQVLSTVPVMFNYWAKPEHTLDLCHLLNDDMAFQIRQNEENQARLYDINNSHREQKFYAFGTLPMQKPELAIEEMSRCVKDLGFQGFQIGSHINEWNLDEKKLYPIWKVNFKKLFIFFYLIMIIKKRELKILTVQYLCIHGTWNMLVELVNIGCHGLSVCRLKLVQQFVVF